VAGLDPHTQRDAFTPYCPVRNVTPDFPPTLLFHGTFDTDVPWQQSADMAAALQKAGVVHEFVSIPEGAHGFDGGVKPEDRHAGSTKPGMMAFEKTLAFFEKYV
jgi:dipeptidyl aminopeptidase/acylaminoacyl peptidase